MGSSHPNSWKQKPTIELESERAWFRSYPQKANVYACQFVPENISSQSFLFKERPLTGDLFWSEFEYFSRLNGNSRAGGKGSCIRGITCWIHHWIILLRERASSNSFVLSSFFHSNSQSLSQWWFIANPRSDQNDQPIEKTQLGKKKNKIKTWKCLPITASKGINENLQTDKHNRCLFWNE